MRERPLFDTWIEGHRVDGIFASGGMEKVRRGNRVSMGEGGVFLYAAFSGRQMAKDGDASFTISFHFMQHLDRVPAPVRGVLGREVDAAVDRHHQRALVEVVPRRGQLEIIRIIRHGVPSKPAYCGTMTHQLPQPRCRRVADVRRRVRVVRVVPGWCG